MHKPSVNAISLITMNLQQVNNKIKFLRFKVKTNAMNYIIGLQRSVKLH